MEKVPYMLVVGDKEAQEGLVAVRRRDKGDMGAISVEKFVETVKKEIADKVAF
jgi:threonyl-tRNA synthetase